MNADVKRDVKGAPGRRRWAWSVTAALVLAGVAVVAPAGTAHADPGIGTNLGQFNATAAQYVQDATPPAGTQFARIEAQGGGGGSGFGETGSSTSGGLGMNIVGYLPIDSTDPLLVAVGQQGQTTPATPPLGGWGNGMDGGDGSVSLCSTDTVYASYSGGGGGATSITTTEASTILVAGGGGGGGGATMECAFDDSASDAGRGGDAGPIPQDGESGKEPDQQNDIVPGGKAGAAPTGAGVSAGTVTKGSGPGGGGGGGALGGTAGTGAPAPDDAVDGGGGGAGTSMTSGMAAVQTSAAHSAADGFVSVTWYSNVVLMFSDYPSTAAAGTPTTFQVTLADPDGRQVDAGDGMTFTTGNPSDTVVGDTITFGDAGPRTVTATFGTATAITELTVVPGAPSSVSVSVPDYAYAGDTITPTLTLVDSEGNAIGPASNAEFFSDSNGDTVNADGTITLQSGVSRTATITAQTVLPGPKVVRDQAQVLVTTDWAYKTKVTASSSLEAFGFGAQQLTDGDTSSSENHHGFTTDPAVSTQDSDAWVAVDLGTSRTIGGVVVSPRTAVAPEPANGTTGAGFPQDFTIDVSDDGTTWTTVATYTGQTGGSGPHTYRFAQAASGRYLRISATLLGPFAEGDDGFRLQLAGLQVYADPAYPAPQSLSIDVDENGYAGVQGVDAYGVPTGQDLNCDVTLTSSNPADEILAPAGSCANAFGVATASRGPRTITATLNSNPSITGTVVYDAGVYGVDLRVTADPMEYGKKSVVHVTGTADTTPEGTVEVREGSKLLAAGPLTSGNVDVTLHGKALQPGRHRLTVRYLASDTHRPATARLSVVVAKATTNLRARVTTPRLTVGSTRAHLRLTATSRVGAPTGQVRAVIAGHVIGRRTLSKGRAVLTLDRFARAGRHTITVRYLGTGTHGPAVVRVPVVIHSAAKH